MLELFVMAVALAVLGWTGVLAYKAHKLLESHITLLNIYLNALSQFVEYAQSQLMQMMEAMYYPAPSEERRGVYA